MREMWKKNEDEEKHIRKRGSVAKTEQKKKT